MGWVIGLSSVIAGLVVAGLVVRRPLARLAEDRRVERARSAFRLRREGLEARFLLGLSRNDPPEASRWEHARWGDDVVWARDRRSRELLALVPVRFVGPAYDAFGEPCPRHATVIFEYRDHQWRADGLRLNEVRPDEVIFRNRRFVPVFTPPTWV